MNLAKGIKGLFAHQKSMGMPVPSWSLINGIWVPMLDNTAKYINDGFKANSYVFSIVSHIVDKASDAPGQMFKVVNPDKAKQWKMLTKDSNDFMSVLKARVLKAQAFEEIKGHPFIDLLEKPNPLQSGKQFMREFLGYFEITGNSFVYAAEPGSGHNANIPQQLWTVPSPCVSIVQGTRTDPVKGYKISYYGDGIIEARKIIHMKSFNPVVDYTGSDFLYGMSKMTTLRLDLSQYKEAQVAQGTLFHNMGPRGLLSGNSEYGPDEKTAIAIKDKFEAVHTGPLQGGGIMVTPADVKFTAIGLSPVDLDLMASKGDTLQAICGVWRYPKELFTGAQNVSSQGENNKKFVTSCVLPLLRDKDDTLTMFARKTYKDESLVYISDTQYFPELQPNRKELADWLKLMEENLTKDEIRAALDYDELPGGIGEHVFVSAGKIKLEDAVADLVDPNVDLLDERDANDYNNEEDNNA